MDPEVDAALRGLEKAAEFAKSYRFEMTEEYLHLIEEVEALQRNQPGTDKSYVWRAQRAFLESFRNVRRLSPKP